MALIFDLFLLLVVCNYASSYFAVGETFGFSSMLEPSWSSSFEVVNDIPDDDVDGRSDGQPTTPPPVSTTQLPAVITTTTVATTTSPPDVVTTPVRTTTRKPRRRRPKIEHGGGRNRDTPIVTGQDTNEEDRTQIVNTITIFKNIVRSIQTDMGQVRDTCEQCTSVTGNWPTSQSDSCADSKASDAKIKQQLRDIKTQIKGLDTAIARITQTVNTIGVQMSGVQPRDCMDLFTRGQSHDGVFYIQPIGVDRPFLAYCEMHDGGGWTMIQRRQEGDNTDFDRGMGSYRRGFGDPNYSHWLGLDHIRSLIQQDEYQLRIEVETYQGRRANAYYSYFKIGGYESNYVLSVGNYNGSAGDAMSFHNGLEFTTKDRDNDQSPANNCASVYRGGWWYGNCLYANLNGVHINQEETESSAIGIIWFDLTGYHSSLRYVSMAVRPTV